jgi:hypothetical protein
VEKPDRPAGFACPEPVIKISSTLDRADQDRRWIEAEAVWAAQQRPLACAATACGDLGAEPSLLALMTATLADSVPSS